MVEEENRIKLQQCSIQIHYYTVLADVQKVVSIFETQQMVVHSG